MTSPDVHGGRVASLGLRHYAETGRDRVVGALEGESLRSARSMSRFARLAASRAAQPWGLGRALVAGVAGCGLVEPSVGDVVDEASDVILVRQERRRVEALDRLHDVLIGV